MEAPPPVWVWGVPFTPVTFSQTLELVDGLIKTRTPRYFITANLHYCMLTDQEPRLRPINENAAFILADGMPIVWASRGQATRLPERVTGSDLVPALLERAAQRGYRVFFLGGAPDVAKELTTKLPERWPTLQIAGIESPPYRKPTPEEHAQLLARIRDSRADILFVAFGQPKGELWMAENAAATGAPASVQIGATVDFLAGRVPRAPRWIQRIGFEWAYRLYREPRRLFLRYWHNGLFLLKMLVRSVIRAPRRSKT
jgi:N-acetylglucosaminyldiphosphoundecaprenol N-acetyl-beta-D-mannosaminyltransferase